MHHVGAMAADEHNQYALFRRDLGQGNFLPGDDVGQGEVRSGRAEGSGVLSFGSHALIVSGYPVLGNSLTAGSTSKNSASPK